jgi:hypothetical protein
MPRLVEKLTRSDPELLKAAGAPASQTLTEYLETIAKFVPVEILAAYMAIRGIIPVSTSPEALPLAIEVALFAALLGLTPLYLLKVGGVVSRKGQQVVIATVSFVVWSYAIGGPFFWGAIETATDAKVVYSAFAGALVVLWSLATGILRPTEP